MWRPRDCYSFNKHIGSPCLVNSIISFVRNNVWWKGGCVLVLHEILFEVHYLNLNVPSLPVINWCLLHSFDYVESVLHLL